MAYNVKPGIDWHEIRERYASGESPYQIAQTVDVSRQAIMKRAKKENWAKPETVTINPGKWLPAVTEFHELSDFPKFSEEKAAKALELIAAGANHAVASAYIGINRETWRNWRDKCPALQEAIEEAQARHATRHLDNWTKASDAGDWKAAQALLASNPLTKEDYTQQKTGGDINVFINIPRASQDEIDQAHKIIDVTPE